MANRATLIFNDGRFGWSESYYDSLSSGGLSETEAAGMILARQRARALAGRKAAALNHQPQIEAMRVSSVEDRVSKLVIFPAPLRGSEDTSADNPYSAIQVLLSLANGKQVSRSISGVSDAAILNQIDAFSQLRGTLAGFLKFLTRVGQPWGALSFDENAFSTRVATITQDDAGRPQLTLEAPIPNVADKCDVKIVVRNYKGAKGTPNINGIQTGSFITPGVSNLVILEPPRAKLTPICLGEVLVWTPTSVKFVDFVIGNPTKRNRGRPLRLPRGRSAGRR